MHASESPISSIMHTNLVTARPEQPVSDVIDLIRGKHVGCIPIVDPQGRALGIVTKLDLIETLGENRSTAREVMLPFARCLEADASVAEAAAIMSGERIHHVLVVNAERVLVGVVSSLDLADWIAREGS